MGRRMGLKVLITGGTGTVGKSFIKEYYDDYEFYSISRNEAAITELAREFPNVKCYIGNICDRDHMINLFCKIKPDIVIHTAAIKHIVGSLNVIKASVRANVKLTIGISTDKACDPDSVYGYTKSVMEKMFMEYHNNETKFVCTRFANVANSNGSVIPFWISESAKGRALKLTDPNMNRLMFTKKDSAELIYTAMTESRAIEDSFILCKIMKNVNLLALAKSLSKLEVKIIGRRPGEKLNETLISSDELPFTSVANEYVYISKDVQSNLFNLGEEHSSANAETMSASEMKSLVWD